LIRPKVSQLTGRSVGRSYQRLLTLNHKSGGNGTNLVEVKDGDGNTTFPIKVASNQIQITDGSNDFDVASHDTSNGLKLGGTLVTSTAAELNILDGVTSTASELNILDGVTSTTAELNILDGVTSTATELNILDGVTSTTAELNIMDGVTSSTAELNILDGVTATTAELNYNDTGSAVGTVVASKTVTADANKDVASFRNVTLTGELDAATLDLSSNADIDGALNVANNVGIGTDTIDSSEWDASAKAVHIYNNATNGSIVIVESSNAKGFFAAGNNHINIGSVSDDPVRFWQNLGSNDPGEVMRISDKGSLLIGTTTDVAESTIEGAVKLGTSINIGSLIHKLTLASSATTVFAVSDIAPSDSKGDGLYMMSVVRIGGSYSSRFVGIFGVDNSSVALVEILENNGITINVTGGTNIQANFSSETTVVATFQPLAVGGI